MIIEIIYALPNEQKSFFIKSNVPITARRAIELSKISDKYLELKNIENFKIGIYGEIIDLNHQLKHRDRLEIYRNLIIDPISARFKRINKK